MTDPSGGPRDGALAMRLHDLFTATARTLEQGGARTEALADLDPAARRLVFERRARMRSSGRVWRLGVLLLRPDGGVLATGRVTRAVPPGHGGHMAVSVEARREVRAAAHRGHFEEGETVNYDATPIDLDPAALRTAAGPLFLAGDRPLVRWSVSADDSAARDLEPYLAERTDLLLHPPQGAT